MKSAKVYVPVRLEALQRATLAVKAEKGRFHSVSLLNHVHGLVRNADRVPLGLTSYSILQRQGRNVSGALVAMITLR